MKRDELRIKLAREGMAAIGQDPFDIGTAVHIRAIKDSNPQAYETITDVFALLVAGQAGEITEASVDRARQMLRELVVLAREVKSFQKGDGRS